MVNTSGMNATFGRMFTPLSNVSPFTYRDGLTYLGVLEEVVSFIKGLVDSINTNVTAIEELREADKATALALQGMLDRQKAFESEVLTILAAQKEELKHLIGEASANGVARNPTTGQVDTTETVLWDMYEYLRVHALFASQLDARGLTAAEHDALGVTARHHDLVLSPTLNATL